MAQQPAFVVPVDPRVVMQRTKTLVPTIGRFALGRAILPIALLQEVPQALEQKLKAIVKKKTRTRLEDKLNTRVLKVQDAVDCLDKTLRDPKMLKDLIGKAVSAFVIDLAVGDPMDALTDPVVECFKEKMLKQTSARARVTYRYSKRAI